MLLRLTLLIIILNLIKSQLSMGNEFSFLIEGEGVEFASNRKNSRVNVLVKIEITQQSGLEKILKIQKLLQGWESYPAFLNSSVPLIGPQYYSLTEQAVTSLVELLRVYDKVVTYTNPNNDRTSTLDCKIIYNPLPLDTMTVHINNLEKEFNSLDKEIGRAHV